MNRFNVSVLSFGLYLIYQGAQPFADKSQDTPQNQTPSRLSITIIITDFEYDAIKPEWAGIAVVKDGQTKPAKGETKEVMDVWNVGKGVSDLLCDELSQLSGLPVQRKSRDTSSPAPAVLGGDQPVLSQSEPVPSAGPGTTRYFVVGSLTRFGGDAPSVGGIGDLALALNAMSTVMFAKAHVGLMARVVDGSTHEILGSITAEGRSKKRGVLLGGLKAKAEDITANGVDMRSASFKKTNLGDATMQAIKDAAQKLVALIDSLSDQQPPFSL